MQHGSCTGMYHKLRFFYIKQFSVEMTAPLILGDILAAKDVATHVPCPDLLGNAKARD